MPDFIDVAITTDQPTIVDAALTQLAADLQASGVTGYVPNEGNMEVILLNVVAQLAADLALMASQVPAAIFRTFGTQLEGLPYNNAAFATATSAWTLTDTLGHTIPGGTQVTLGGFGFYVETDVVVGATTSATVALIAVDSGTGYNGLSGAALLVDNLNFVASVLVTTPSSGGSDQETDLDYQDRLAEQLALQAPRPITAPDYAAFVRTVPVTVAGVVVGRATAIDGYDPTVTTFTGTTNGTTTVSAVSSFTGITAGSILNGTGVTNNVVVSINTGANTLVLTTAATGSHAAQTMTSTGSYGNERTVTVFVTDTSGNALTSLEMTTLDTWLQGFREVNFLVYVKAATYTTVYITYEIHVLPGYIGASVVTNVNTALTQFLNPLLWANPLVASGAGSAAWADPTLGFNIVRYNKVLGIIEGVPGVDYVPSGSSGLAIALTASPVATANLTLPGPAPLPLTDLVTPTIIGSAV